ncbi:MAG: fibronectin type III domain-containing protein [Bacteroidales bacterium]|nr:fibronectin type III domain-containing protein [Bacteroidales bacterium]
MIPAGSELPLISAAAVNPNARVDIQQAVATNPLQAEFTASVVVSASEGLSEDTYHITFRRSNSDWEWVSPQPSGNNFADAYRIDEHKAYAIGSNGSFFKTIDGGRTWTARPMNTFSTLQEIYFLNTDTGLIAGSNGTIFTSCNGGLDWIPVNSGTSQTLFDISFINDHVGFICGSNGHILKSVNSGKDWEVLYRNDAFHLHTISFLNETTGVAFGTNNTMLRTMDGGKIWWRFTLDYAYNDFCFINDSTGIAIGRSGYLFKTTDGGIHWKYEEINTTLLPSFTAIRFFSETEGYIMGEYGILKTGDGGETWHEVYDTDEKIGFSSLIKFDESNLNAFGDRGRILVSGDGGETWKEKEVYTSFWRLDFASDSVVYASDYIYNGSSYDSPVFKSRNGGKNWSVVDTIMNAAVYDISFTDSLSGYLVDYFGNVFKTKNGGMEWNSSNLGIYTYCIEMIDDHTGFIGGRNGAIFKTTDDWATWENVNNTGKTTYIADIAFADHLNGVACGQSGTLLTTRDGGNSWTDVPALTTANLERIDYTDPLHINITGGTVFLGSEDGGSTWTSLDLDLSATAFGIAFTDQLTGYICSVQEVLKTENGGRTWVNHYYSSSPTFVSLTENLSGIPHIHGYIGSLLKAVDVVSGAEGLITSHPESVTGVVGDSVRFSISASIGNFTYKWLRNGIEIGDNDKITGTDTPELVIRNIILQDQADYACRVTAGDTAVISRNGYLRVKPLVEIITPNGGEEVFSEVPFIIHYVARKPSAGEISLSVNKGFTWRTIATYVLPDTGAYSFVWTDIPAVSSDYCLLRIADNHYKSSADISDHPFRLHRGANIPEDPSNLEVSNFGMTTVTLDWYDNSDNESGFRLLRTNAATSHTDTIPVEQNRTAWNDSGLDPGTEYLYHIFAFNEYGNSNNSNTVQVVTGQIPGAPSNLSAGEGDDIIVWLKWTDNSDNEEHFVIERRVNSGAWSTIETVLANTVAWSDYVVNAGFNYSYRIKAENRFGESACSAVETVYIESVPEKPLNFRAEVISVSEVRLTWLDVADNEDRYEVYRHGSNDNFTRIATISRNSEVYYDSGLLPGTYYYYRVKVISESGKYTYSDTYGILTGSRPSAPVGFTINQSGADQLRLSWYRGSANTDYYRIDRKMNNGSWVTIMSKTSGTTYTDYGVSAGRTYSYRVFAVNRYDISIPTNALSFTIVPPPSVVKKHKIYARDNKGAYRAGARVYIKSSYQELFTESTYKGTTNPSGYLEVDPLKSGDEILVMLKVDDVPAVKSEHESVDNIMYSVYLDNGEIQSDGTYSFYHHGRTFPVNDEATVINLNHPVILYNLVVCFKNNPDDEFISEFDTCMTNVANILFDATDGHISLNKIAYFDVDDINDYNADIVVTDNRETWPNALVGGIEMKWEPFIIVRHSTVKIGPAIYFNNIYYKPNSLRYSRALTHEIFHYALKLYEEYLDGTGLRSLKIGGNSSFRPYNYSIMDDGWVDIYDRELTNEEMQTEMKYFPSRAVSVSEISSLKEYLPNYSFPRDIDKVTEQYYHNYDGSRRYSAWDWIAYKFSTAHSNLGIQLTKPDYDYYRGTWSYRRPYRPGPYETYFTFMPELPDYKVKGPAKAGGEIVFATLPVNSKVFTENNLNGYFQGLADQFGAISLAKSGEFDDLRFYKIDRHRVLFDTVGNIFNSYDPAPLIANTPPVAPGVLVQNRISESDSLLQCSFLLVTDSSAAGIPVMQEITLSRDPLAVSTLFENVHEAVLLMDEADYYSEPFYLNLSLEDSNGQSWNYLVKNAVKVNLRDRVTVHRIDNAEFVFGENATAADEIILYSSITGIPLHAKSQDLIPISEYYGFSMLSTKALEEPIALNIDYMILPADGIDETSVNMYQWVDESGYWSALRNSTPDMAGDVVSALIDEPGIYALFARLSGTDTIGPGPVTDLNAFPAENSQVLLTWTAPGDDGFQGQAMHYELRYALDEITEINWNSAEPVFGMPVPSPAGSDEQAFVPIIDTMALYCFAVKTTDDAGHVSELSNPAWSAPGISLDREHISITFSDDHEVLNSIFIGKEIHATDHFDYDTDILIPEAGEGLVVYTLCPDNSKLHEDIRSSAAGSITWEVHVEGVAPDYDEIIIEWDPTSLPDDGNYHIAGMDMGKTREFSIYRDSVFDIVFEKYPEGLRIPDRTEEEDFADFHVNINHYFPEEDTLSFFVTIEYGDVGAVIESDSLLIIRSVQDWYGESSILITGLSSAGAEYNQSFNLNILPVNDPPQFTSQPILEASVDSAYFYAITGEDVDEGDSVYIAYDKIPSWLALDPVTWQLSGMPSREDTTGNDVVLKISDGEADALQAFSITVNTATNLRDLSLQGSIRIYPNPTSGKLMVEISEAIKEGIMLEITDPSGKLLSQQMLKMETDNAHVIDISSYPSGLYNFVFKLRDAVQRISVVKE